MSNSTVSGAGTNGADGVDGTSDTGNGVYGQSDSGSGVSGFCGTGAGVYGQSQSSSGVCGIAGHGSGVLDSRSSGQIGVYGAGATGVYGTGGIGGLFEGGGSSPGVYAHSADGAAGSFWGDVQVSGTLTKSGGGFKIDHPLDPANRYLYHSFVESSEMKNVYDGVVTLDSTGQIEVELPAWFEAVNRDFRYQLTPIGAPAPGLHIARKVSDGRFAIAGGQPGLEVSWQVTGVRKDAWAQANPLQAEKEKPLNEQGFYIQPELHGEPQEKGMAGFWRTPAGPR
jgi:hypothetical protein